MILDLRGVLLCGAILHLALPSEPGLRGPDGFGMTPEQFWHLPFGTEQRMPTAGDADGDSRADLISLWPTGDGVIDLARTSALGKPTYGNAALSGFGRDGLAGACGPFVRAKADDYLAAFADGSIRVAWGCLREPTFTSTTILTAGFRPTSCR
ncbi:MAG TPA: hypothetical protein VHE55_02525 [Fimbriimonadaceae bacterium]|nr:hypothetical protein [Fimbriimonadaceae bacterium]